MRGEAVMSGGIYRGEKTVNAEINLVSARVN